MSFKAMTGVGMAPGLFRYAAPSYGVAVRLVQAIALFVALGSGAAEARTLKLVVLGDSLTAGYGLKAGEGFPEQLGVALRAAGFDVEVVNAGVSGDTAEDALARFDWSVPADGDALIVELGANDMLRAQPVAAAKAAVGEILQKAAALKMKVLVAGMLATSSLPKDYRDAFQAMYPALAEAASASLYPFFLAGVAGNPKLNQADGMHPTREGVAIIVNAMLPSIEDLLRSAGPK
jgi:acyl-CoA thioesterase-1